MKQILEQIYFVSQAPPIYIYIYIYKLYMNIQYVYKFIYMCMPTYIQHPVYVKLSIKIK